MARLSVALVPALIGLMAGAASAADDAVARATRLYERHQYEEAAQALQTDLPTLNPASRATAHLTLGVIYLGNAELHRELHQTALVVQLDYLKKLAAVRGAAGSRFVNLYLGRALLENGDAREAAKYLERFSAQPGLPPRYKAIAGASLGLSHFLTRNPQAARAQWATVDTADPEAQVALAAVYSRAGLKDRDPVGLGDAALKKVSSPSSRMLESLLTVYARAGLTDKGLELVRQADLKTASYTEALGETKTISFYDVAALGDLAAVFGARASCTWKRRRPTRSSSRRPTTTSARPTPRSAMWSSCSGPPAPFCPSRPRRRRSEIGRASGRRPASTCRADGATRWRPGKLWLRRSPPTPSSWPRSSSGARGRRRTAPASSPGRFARSRPARGERPAR